MTDYENEKEKLKNIEKMLADSGGEYDWIDINLEKGDVKPCLICPISYKGITLDVLISYQVWDEAEWICMRCFVYDTSALDDKKLIDVYRLSLSLNFSIPETTFSILNDFLYIESDMPLDVSKDDFDFEVKGFEWGVGNFVENMKKLGLSVSPTHGVLKKEKKKLSYIS